MKAVGAQVEEEHPVPNWETMPPKRGTPTNCDSGHAIVEVSLPEAFIRGAYLQLKWRLPIALVEVSLPEAFIRGAYLQLKWSK